MLNIYEFNIKRVIRSLTTNLLTLHFEAPYCNPIKTNNKIHGRRTSNQEIPTCPSLHIKLRIYVQNRI